MSSAGISTAQLAVRGDAGPSLSKKGDLELPPIKNILSDLSEVSFSLPPRTETIDSEEQQEMFHELRDIIEKAQEVDDAGNSFDLKELHASLEEADANAKRGRRDADTLQSVSATLQKLWACNSEYLVQATEIIADGSRDRGSILYTCQFYNLLIMFQLHGVLHLASLAFCNSSWMWFL